MTIDPHPIAGDFNGALYSFLKPLEGFIQKIYTDSVGIPTLGLGYALAERAGKINGIQQYKLIKTLPADLAAMGVTLTQKDLKLLQDEINVLNSGNLTAAQQLIPPASNPTNPFSFTLTGEAQFFPLFNILVDRATKTVQSAIGSQLFASLAGSKEMEALL